ncbi:MAG: GNAT family N-acetyltransferase [Comamonadaceae bacterium CG1_02_60_18]|nr:MAG: GNAT family N-acetyltransferase [Comamonadaceae bacterium CG1_02_60_18]PIQ50474.1 MAG: GNAT family N-acetyltransferase [Comamonadaceae bacterium CG12_big_fil_rev_8_21_14_0_65_59_15]
MPIFRPSQPNDIEQITTIYAHHVLHGTGTFEMTPPTVAEMGQRRDDVLAKHLPYLVAVDGERVLGYAYCNWFKPRPAYRFSAEDSIYLAPDCAGQGIGRALLAELCAQAERWGVRRMISVIGDSANQASIGVHRSVGFAPVGVLSACGWKFGRWLDVVMMDKALGAGNTCPPDEVITR